jgi:hypothetical protein
MEIGYHKFPSGKQYTFWNDNGTPVFLRNIIFLTNSTNPTQVAIVREWPFPHENRKSTNIRSWEPPKGQAEWDVFAEFGIKRNSTVSPKLVEKAMRANVLREMFEEAKVPFSKLKGFKKMDAAYRQPWPESDVPKAHFMYQFWTATITPQTLLEAKKDLQELAANPDWREMLAKDLSEKDDITWWSPGTNENYIRGGFSKKMIDMYYSR